MTGPVVVVGDALLDRDVEGVVERVCPEAPVPVVDEVAARARPGGAALAASLAAADPRGVVLVTALGRDEAGAALGGLLVPAGVEVVDLGLEGPTPEKVRIRSDGRLLLRVDRGGSPAGVGAATARAREALRGAAAVLVADYGRGLAAEEGLREELARLAGRRPVVWDPHPRGPEPVPGARLATPNRAEAAAFAAAVDGDDLGATGARARLLRDRWSAHAVAVTLGEEGAVLVEAESAPLVVPAPRASGGDPCGAGDCFASAAAAVLAEGALVAEAVEEAVRSASAFVARGGARALDLGRGERAPATPESDDAYDVARRVRASGGTVVATGGCFDLLHSGHVSMLQAARELGDCLIVCLNSDASVRRLKGEDRPLVPEDDRAAVLGALGCVDAVVVFEEDTPAALLERLRPDLFAKGGDYTADELPEAAVVERWGGDVVILPYVAGRSTTGLIGEVAYRGR